MNNDKHNITAPETGSICDLPSGNATGGPLPYDETDLLSKMFSKDHQ
jgi:hypothetical protein